MFLKSRSSFTWYRAVFKNASPKKIPKMYGFWVSIWRLNVSFQKRSSQDLGTTNFSPQTLANLVPGWLCVWFAMWLPSHLRADKSLQIRRKSISKVFYDSLLFRLLWLFIALSSCCSVIFLDLFLVFRKLKPRSRALDSSRNWRQPRQTPCGLHLMSSASRCLCPGGALEIQVVRMLDVGC